MSGSSISWAIWKSAPRSRRQHSTTIYFTGQMPFLPPNQQCQSTETCILKTSLQKCSKWFVSQPIKHRFNPQTWSKQWTVFPDFPPTFCQFHDFSLTAVKFPDASRFSTQVVTWVKCWQRRLPACQFVVGKRKLAMNKSAGFVLERMEVVMIKITGRLALHKHRHTPLIAKYNRCIRLPKIIINNSTNLLLSTGISIHQQSYICICIRFHSRPNINQDG